MNLQYLYCPITALVVLFPVFVLTIKRGANACLYLLVLTSLVCIAFRCKPMGQTFLQVLKKYWLLHLSMAGTTLAILAQQISTGVFISKTYDISSRLTFFALMAWVLLLLPVRHLKQVQWGFVAGAIAAAIKVQIISAGQPVAPGTIDFLNRIPYGDISLLLGVFSFLSLGWNERKDKWAIILKLAGGCAGLYSAYLCQTRGGWVALPVFAVIGLVLLGRVHVRHKLAVFGAVLVLLGTIYSFNSVVQSRVHLAASDISQYMNGENLDTSIGIRFQHWHGSWVLFKEHPIVGIGRQNFYPQALLDLHSRNIITRAATNFVHTHNELFFNMATLGIFGFIAFWALHVVPAYYFFQAARDLDREIRTAGTMGLALCLGFFVFGLTEVIFFTPAACGFYSMSAAVFFAFVLKRKQALADQST